MRGTLVNVNRSFGHVAIPEYGDVFIHFADCNFKLCDANVGDTVEVPFVVETDKGWKANVRRERWHTEAVTWIS